jgi:hypothetical protein
MISKGLTGASTKPIILAILRRKESYGYEIIQEVKDLTGGRARLVGADALSVPQEAREGRPGQVPVAAFGHRSAEKILPALRSGTAVSSVLLSLFLS